MQLKNLTRKSVITSDLKEAKSLIDLSLGLILKSNPRSLLFKTNFGIHTFFLKESIDVIVLDKNYQVVKLATVVPNSFFFWNPKYSLVIELPVGDIKKSQSELRDQLKLKD